MTSSPPTRVPFPYEETGLVVIRPRVRYLSDDAVDAKAAAKQKEHLDEYRKLAKTNVDRSVYRHAVQFNLLLSSYMTRVKISKPYHEQSMPRPFMWKENSDMHASDGTFTRYTAAMMTVLNDPGLIKNKFDELVLTVPLLATIDPEQPQLVECVKRAYFSQGFFILADMWRRRHALPPLAYQGINVDSAKLKNLETVFGLHAVDRVRYYAPIYQALWLADMIVQVRMMCEDPPANWKALELPTICQKWLHDLGSLEGVNETLIDQLNGLYAEASVKTASNEVIFLFPEERSKLKVSPMVQKFMSQSQVAGSNVSAASATATSDN